MRIPMLRREKAAVVYLRSHFGYSINIIAKAFSRSTASIHAILKFNEFIGAIRKFENRKLPTRIKLLQSARQHRTIMAYLSKWNAWILEEEEKPP